MFLSNLMPVKKAQEIINSSLKGLGSKKSPLKMLTEEYLQKK